MFEPGRNLDTLIADKVFRWRALYSQDGAVRELWPPTVDPFSPRPDWSQCAEPPDWGIVPYYSTSISDAWRVVTKMTDRMGTAAHPHFSWAGPLYKPATIALEDPEVSPGANCWYVAVQSAADAPKRFFAADTAPLAVCLAALAIAEVESTINRDLKEIPSGENDS